MAPTKKKREDFSLVVGFRILNYWLWDIFSFCETFKYIFWQPLVDLFKANTLYLEQSKAITLKSANIFIQNYIFNDKFLPPTFLYNYFFAFIMLRIPENITSNCESLDLFFNSKTGLRGQCGWLYDHAFYKAKQSKIKS